MYSYTFQFHNIYKSSNRTNYMTNTDLKKILRAASLTAFIHGMVGFLYIATSAMVHPETLSIQLSHLTPWIREDTFGFLSFAISIVSLFIYDLTKD